MNTAAILLNIFLTIYQKAVTGQYKAAEREKNLQLQSIFNERKQKRICYFKEGLWVQLKFKN